MFDDSIDAWFMCITLLLPVGSVPRFLLCKEHINYRQDKLSWNWFSSLLFCLLLLCIKKTTTNLHTKSRVQTFTGSLSAAGLVCPQSGNPKKLKILLPVHYCIYVLYVHHYTTYVCQQVSKQQANYWSVVLFLAGLMKLYETTYYWKWHQWNTSWQLFYHDWLWYRDHSLILTLQYCVVPENIHISPWNGFM